MKLSCVELNEKSTFIKYYTNSNDNNNTNDLLTRSELRWVKLLFFIFFESY